MKSEVPAFDPFTSDDSLSPSGTIASTIARRRILRYAETDSTVQRQLDHPTKVVFSTTNAWRSIPFPLDTSPGVLLVQRLVPDVDRYINKTLATARKFFKALGITTTEDFRNGAYFVTELLFKPTFGQWLLNGDITISDSRIILGCVDHRYRSRSMVETRESLLESRTRSTNLRKLTPSLSMDSRGTESTCTRTCTEGAQRRQASSTGRGQVIERSRLQEASSSPKDQDPGGGTTRCSRREEDGLPEEKA